MAVTTTTVGATLDQVRLSLQARLEQIEAGLNEAHVQVKRMQAPEEQKEPEVPVVQGALACADRCMERVSRLVSRLTTLADEIGTL